MSDRAFRVAGYVLLAVWIVFALHYAFDARPMYAPYGDTGADVNAVGSIAAFVTSARNVLAMVGWQTWADYQQFYYLPMGNNVIDVPLQLFVNNPFATIKLVFALIFTVAFFATAALYGAVVSQSKWRWLAAAIYATIPMTTLQNRLTPIGWIVALIPLALLLNLWLVRRFGARAAPAVGIVCALATAAFDVEYAIFAGLPLLVLSWSLARSNGVRVTVWFAGASALAFFLLPSYTVVATIFGQHLMTWLRPNQALPAQLESFSPGIYEQLAGVLKEATISADPAFNASQSLNYAVAGGAAVWVLAIVGSVWAVATLPRRTWAPVLTVAFVCFALSFGPTIPAIGPPLWALIGRIPILQALRTPDRFEQINALLTALAAAYGASLLAARGRIGSVVAGAFAVIIVGSYLAFSAREHVLALQELDAHVPDYAAATAAVTKSGGRAAIFGFPLQGSQYDDVPYAPDAPGVAFAWDLAGRFGNGDAGVPLLRRAAVRSIVTTPNWTRVSESGIPADLAVPVARSAYAKPLGPFAHGVNVFALDARPMVASVRPLCTYGGPAAYETAAGLRVFDNDALVHEAQTQCEQTLFADYDPLDAQLPGVAAAAWSGEGVFGSSEVLPLPYAFVVDRFGIAAPWYKNAYRGDSLLSAQPFQTYGYSGATLVFAASRAGRYAVYVRIAGLATLQTQDGRGRQVTGQSRRVAGFAWVKLPLNELRAGSYQLPLEVVDAPESNAPAVVDTVVVAPAELPPSPLVPAYVLASTRTFEPPVAVRSYQYVFPRPSNQGITAKSQSARLLPGTEIGLVGGEARISAAGRIGGARFRWNGPTGRYVVVAAGWFNEQAPTMTLRAGAQALQIRYDPSTGIAPSSGYAHMDLVHGAPIDVVLDARPGGIASLTQITAMPVQAEETPTSYDGTSETWQFAKNDPMQFYEAIHSDDVALAAGTIRAFPGAAAEIPFDPVFSRGKVTADVQVSGGRGTTELRCGSQVDRSSVGGGTENPGGAALVVERTANDPCVLRIAWNSETLTLESVLVHARGPTVANWSAVQYFARGTYAWSGGRGIELDVDGRSWKSSSLMDLRAGSHVLTLRRAPVDAAPLIFRRANAAKPAAPPGIRVEERSATSWDAAPSSAATLELAQFDDGNWFARGDAQRTFGYACDLVNTCFDVGGGSVYVGRRLPPILAFGLAVTLLDALAALAVLFSGEIRKRSGASVAS